PRSESVASRFRSLDLHRDVVRIVGLRLLKVRPLELALILAPLLFNGHGVSEDYPLLTLRPGARHIHKAQWARTIGGWGLLLVLLPRGSKARRRLWRRRCGERCLVEIGDRAGRRRSDDLH